MIFLNNFDKYVLQFNLEGSSVLEIQIYKNRNPVDLIEMMSTFNNIEPKRLNCTFLDCKANIFLLKSQIVPKL